MFLRESWWHIGLKDNGGIKSMEMRIVFKNQHFRGFIALDTSARFSDSMKSFIGVLRESHDTVVQHCPVISTDCHILYSFLQQMVPSWPVEPSHICCLSFRQIRPMFYPLKPLRSYHFLAPYLAKDLFYLFPTSVTLMRVG